MVHMRWATGIVLVCAAAASAGITGYTVYADSSIQQYKNGDLQQTQHVAKGYPTTVGQTPVQARTQINDTASTPSYLSLNRVVSNSPQYNKSLPTDFVLETAAGSNDSAISLTTSSLARQTRSITVAANDFSPAESVGTALTLTSTFTLDGGLAAVIPSSVDSAAGLALSLAVDITRDGKTLTTRTIQLVGRSDGTIVVANSNFADSDYTLTRFALTDHADAVLLNFDDLQIPFDYDATVGDSFDLQAEVAVDMTLPGGLGGGAAFGTLPTQTILLAQELYAETPTGKAAKGQREFAPAGMTLVPEPTTLLTLIASLTIARLRRRAH